MVNVLESVAVLGGISVYGKICPNGNGDRIVARRDITGELVMVPVKRILPEPNGPAVGSIGGKYRSTIHHTGSRHGVYYFITHRYTYVLWVIENYFAKAEKQL